MNSSCQNKIEKPATLKLKNEVFMESTRNPIHNLQRYPVEKNSFMQLTYFPLRIKNPNERCAGLNGF